MGEIFTHRGQQVLQELVRFGTVESASEVPQSGTLHDGSGFEDTIGDLCDVLVCKGAPGPGYIEASFGFTGRVNFVVGRRDVLGTKRHGALFYATVDEIQ